jgi:hypothetical protein
MKFTKGDLVKPRKHVAAIAPIWIITGQQTEHDGMQFYTLRPLNNGGECSWRIQYVEEQYEKID